MLYVVYNPNNNKIIDTCLVYTIVRKHRHISSLFRNGRYMSGLHEIKKAGIVLVYNIQK